MLPATKQISTRAMPSIIERLLIRLLKATNTDLLPHAHVQIGVGHNTYQSGEEYILREVIKSVLKREPEIIFDVGANVGEYAGQLAGYFPGAKIYCFEPLPNNYESLVHNTTGLNTTNILTAVGSGEGTLKLHIGEDNTNGQMATAHRESLETVFSFVGKKIDTIEVPLTTLDIFCGNTIKRIDFLKIDVEGHEYEVLKGAANLLKADKISIIQFEFNEFNIFSRTFMFDFYQVLKKYTLYRVMPQNKIRPMGPYNSALEIFRYQNILAIHNSLDYAPAK